MIIVVSNVISNVCCFFGNVQPVGGWRFALRGKRVWLLEILFVFCDVA
ncbi:BadM/Rrf2 family transcriptional regulator [Neisseria wadsworthii 9715]|uniref:BadM/Rrf2 family transcriptional regulator n=1 Tax=Neisseria wadsworthii 9715 TaxID=1030841 RepID=G4CPM3_9NEIS|nr:BadM/Rrf2 family transcriptional regulator [Neisseria wadsworthii 9715]